MPRALSLGPLQPLLQHLDYPACLAHSEPAQAAFAGGVLNKARQCLLPAMFESALGIAA